MAKSTTASKTVKKQQDAPKTFSRSKSAVATRDGKVAGLNKKKLDEMQAEKGEARKMAGPKTKVSAMSAMAAAKEKENNVPSTEPKE